MWGREGGTWGGITWGAVEQGVGGTGAGLASPGVFPRRPYNNTERDPRRPHRRPYNNNNNNNHSRAPTADGPTKSPRCCNPLPPPAIL